METKPNPIFKYFSANKINSAKLILPVICVGLALLCAFIFIDKRIKIARLETKKASLLRENLDLKDRISALESQTKEAQDALNTATESAKDIENQIATLKAENEKLNKDMQELSAAAAEKDGLQEKISLLQEENDTLKKKLSDLENKSASDQLKESISKEKNPAVKKILEDALQGIAPLQASGSVNLEDILVKKDIADLPQDIAKNILPVAGKVISVDTKNNLLAINLGKKDGLEVNDKCIIVNPNNELEAYAEVISVRYELSAAFVDRVKAKFRLADIKEGDKVLITKQ